ncbi:---NA--- : [Gemmataceae bacterium]|nr:---NA--- : [Gemmataceae bacterium]VTT97060.1 ---NA--- : [Gemmataceae bacterium]
MRMLQLKPRHTITRLALSPDGSRVAVGQPGHGVRVIETLSGADLEHLFVPAHTTAPVRYNSPTGRYGIELVPADARLAQTRAWSPEFRFQPGWRREWDRNSPPDESPGVLVDATSQGGAWLFPRPVPGRMTAWYRLAPCGISADHRFAVGRAADRRERIVLFDLVREEVVGQFPNARGFGIPFYATFTPSNQVVIADSEGISVYPMLLQIAEVPTPTPEADPPQEPERGPIGRFVQALFRTGPRTRKARGPAALAPRPVPMLDPWATIVPTVPQPDTEIPPFALLPCGRRMIVRGEKSRVELRDVATGEVLTVWKWGLPRVNALAVSANGLLAAAAGAKGQLMLWDLE